MRAAFIQVASYSTARRKAPWAAVICKVSGGYRAFESVTDWRIWRNQR